VQEVVRSNDPVLISFLRSLLLDSGIPSVELDGHASILEGGGGAIRCRLMVSDNDADLARGLLADAELD
jgi:hypothetical protein